LYIRLYMCAPTRILRYIQRPHTAIYVSAYYYVSSGLILLSMCPHTTAVVGAVAAYQPLVLLCMLIYVSAYYCSSRSRSSGSIYCYIYMCVCVLILLYVYILYCYIYMCVCVLILLYAYFFFHKKKTGAGKLGADQPLL
jgi:hypothetical protein